MAVVQKLGHELLKHVAALQTLPVLGEGRLNRQGGMGYVWTGRLKGVYAREAAKAAWRLKAFEGVSKSGV